MCSSDLDVKMVGSLLVHTRKMDNFFLPDTVSGKEFFEAFCKKASKDDETEAVIDGLIDKMLYELTLPSYEKFSNSIGKMPEAYMCSINAENDSIVVKDAHVFFTEKSSLEDYNSKVRVSFEDGHVCIEIKNSTELGFLSVS